MAIVREFELVNTVVTGLKRVVHDKPSLPGTRIQGFCTGASMLYCRKCLEVPRWFPHTREDAPWGDTQAQVAMHKMNLLNGDANGLAATVQLKQKGGFKNTNSADQVRLALGQTDSKVGIFWNSYHTIGIKLGQSPRGNAAELWIWDQNFGFFTMGASELGSYYSKNYPQSALGGSDQILGYLGLGI